MCRLGGKLGGRRVDAVHLATSGDLAVIRDLGVVYLAALFHVPVIYHIHFGRIPQVANAGSLEWRLLSKVMLRAQAVIVIDKATCESIKTHLPLANLRLIPNGVNFSEFPCSGGVKSQEKIALFVGWVVSTKGVAELMEAWAKVQPEGWRLQIAGPGDPLYRQRLIERFRPVGIEFLGELPHQETMDRLAACDLFVLPSYTEGFPNAVLEAMALGKAIVATDVGAIPEMLEGECGVLVKPQDVSNLADAIRLVCMNPRLRSEMGDRARVRALGNYSIDAVFEAYLSLWRQAALMGNEPIRVCLIAPVPPPYGGIAHWTQMIYRYSQTRSDVMISAINTAPHWRSIHGGQLWKRSIGGGVQFIRDICRLGWMLGSQRVNAIHLTTSGHLAVMRDLGVVYVAALFHVPVFYHIRFGRIPQVANAGSLEWRLLSKVMLRAQAVIVIDKATCESIKTHLPLANLQLIPNCINFSELPSLGGVKPQEKIALFVGWVVSTKGVAELMEAWAKVQPEGWRLQIAGPGDPLYRQRLIERFRPVGIEFLGELPHQETMDRLAACDLFVLPSYTEGFPNAVLEAMALGKAIVATDVGAIPEMLEGECGVLVKPQDVSNLADAIRLVCMNPRLRSEMGDRARVRALGNYSIDAVFEIYLSLWRQAATPFNV